MKFKEAIKVTEANASYLLKLPCVRGIMKEFDGKLHVVTNFSHDAEVGDWLCEDSEGAWHVVSDVIYKELNSR